MTLNDIIGNINIQGKVKIMTYHYKAPVNEEYECCYETEFCNGGYDIPEELRNKEISYMYANDDGYLWIEIEEEEK